MTIGYILTIAQKDLIQGAEFAPYECFHCLQDVNGIWFNFVSEQQIPLIEATEYAWVLQCPQGEYTPPPAPPFPPTN